MICISVNEQDINKVKEILSSAAMAEIRADLCKLSLDQISEILEHPNLLFTCRIENSSREFAYEQMVHAIKKGAKMVDVEIEAPIEHLDFIKQYANDCRCKLIISYHDYNGTLSYSQLEQIFELCLRKGADIVKIVTTANNTEDAVRVMQLYKSKFFNGKNLVAFAMGEAGKFTRKLCLDLGSPFTYIAYSQDTATAPGQFTLDEFNKINDDSFYKYFFGEENIELPLKINIPCSKSVAQRAILAAALAKGESVLTNFSPCNDINGALDVVRSLGCDVNIDGSVIKIKSNGADSLHSVNSIFVGESGLLTRLLFPLCGYLGDIIINGHGSILKRNLQDAFNALESAGVDCKSERDGFLPVKISGGIKNFDIKFSGKESSQIVSGFLMTLPLLERDSVLTISNPTSIPYINITLDCLRLFGVEVDIKSQTLDEIVYYIKGKQCYKSANVRLEPDWSSAAFFAVGGAIKGAIVLEDMPLKTSQADIKILDLIKDAGVNVSFINNDVHIKRDGDMRCFVADLTDAPDLFPIATLLAIYCNGVSKLAGVNRLYQKESNRAESVYSQFTILGADINIVGNDMYIAGDGGACLKSGRVCSYNDHRIAMSLIIAALFIKDGIKLDDINCINKSFPGFLNFLLRK